MARSDPMLEEHPDIVEMQARYDRVAASSTAQSVEGATLLAGLYAAISPWVIGFGAAGRDLMASNLVCGITVAVLGLCYASVYGRTHGLSWVAPVLGAWMIASPWVILGTTVTAGMGWSNVITGAIIVLLGLATLGMAGARTRRPVAAGRRP